MNRAYYPSGMNLWRLADKLTGRPKRILKAITPQLDEKYKAIHRKQFEAVNRVIDETVLKHTGKTPEALKKLGIQVHYNGNVSKNKDVRRYSDRLNRMEKHVHDTFLSMNLKEAIGDKAAIEKMLEDLMGKLSKLAED